MNRFFLISTGVLLLTLSHFTLASCSYSGGAVNNVVYGFAQSQITVGAELANGTALLTQSSRPSLGNITVTCTSSSAFSISRVYADGTVLTPSGLNGPYGGPIYKSKVPGLGFYMFSTNVPFPNLGSACGAATSCTQTVNSFFVALLVIKIGDITPGSVLKGADLPCIDMSFGQQSNMMVNVVKSCFSGSLAVTNLTCNTPADVPVSMGTHDVSEFNGVSSKTEWQDASIKLTQCPPFYGNNASGIVYSNSTVSGVSNSANSISLTLSPTGTIQDAVNGIINLSSDSTAKGIGIQLASGTISSPAVIDFSQSTQAEITLPNNASSSNITIPLLARYVQTAPAMAPGTANGKLIYTISYY
jgi:type 1 fimbria pilin